MFNRHDEVEITIPGEGGKPKLAVVVHPTDAQWIERTRGRHTFVKNLGRGNSQATVIGKEESDLKLLKLIQKNEDVTFDGFEASAIVEEMGTCDVIDGVRANDAFVFTAKVLGDVDTKHTVRIPGFRELKICSDASNRSQATNYGGVKVTANLQPAADLYDKYVDLIEGYVGKDPAVSATHADVPITHKYVVINALNQEIQNLKVSIGKESETFPVNPGPNSQASGS